ncbi:hypothetical protein ACQ4PT_041153 [Festuca glaucescens]
MALSDLHDDLLRRILYFTAAKEAASTSALARRWRLLWPSSGAVNLDSFPYSSAVHDNHSSEGDPVRDAFLRGADAALAASRPFPVRKLTFHLEAETNQRGGWSTSVYHVLDAVLSSPAAFSVEELRVESQLRVPNLRINSLPFVSLKVLDISMCHCQSRTPAALAFPRLEAMRLHRCVVRAKDLQGMIDAAPLLTTLQLHEVQVVVPCERIRCPRVTTLVLADLYWRDCSWRGGMELDTPMLRNFRYRGFIRPFSLEPPPAEITSVDLQFYGDNNHRQSHDERCRLFWQFVSNFTSAKILKLRVVHLEHIILADKRKTAGLIGNTVFSNLHRLDLLAFYTLGRRAGGVAFAIFLRCCPMIRVLRLELSTVDGDPSKSASHVQDFLDEQGKLDLCKSVDHFIRPQTKTGNFLGWRR